MKILSAIKKNLKNSFLKNVFTLLTGSVVSQMLVFFSIPILTRLFDETIFGVYVLFSSAILLLKTIASLNYEFAILLPKRDKDAINVLFFNFIIISLFSVVLFTLVFFFKAQILFHLNIQKIGSFIYVLPLSVFFIASVTALEYWNNRMDAFKNISTGAISKSSTMCVGQITTGFSSFSALGLIPGLLLGQFMNFIVLLKLSFKNIYKYKHHISINRMFLLVKKYKDIPLFNTLLHFTDVLSSELPVLLITKYYGLSYAGLYGLSQKLTKTPSGIVGGSVNQVFFNTASKLYNKGQGLYDFVLKTYKHLIWISVLIFLALFASSYFLNILFGEDWNETGLYVRILIPWLLLAFVNSPISSIVSILNKQKSFVVYEVVLLIFRFLAIYFGYMLFQNIIVSLVLLSAVGFIYNIFCTVYFLKISKLSHH